MENLNKIFVSARLMTRASFITTAGADILSGPPLALILRCVQRKNPPCC